MDREGRSCWRRVRPGRHEGRGRYRVDCVPFAEPRASLRPGEFTERYARMVEAQIRESPPDWPWSHKRWRLRKPLYE